MIETLYVYNMNECIGKLTCDKYTYKFYIKEDIKENSKNKIKTMGLNSEDSDIIYQNLIEDRVISKDNQAVNNVLTRLGMMSYEPWEIFKRTKGMNAQDYLWVSERKDSADEFWEVHPCAKEAEGIIDFKNTFKMAELYIKMMNKDLRRAKKRVRMRAGVHRVKRGIIEKSKVGWNTERVLEKIAEMQSKTNKKA